MKYYSEKTKKLFDSEKELVNYEKEFERLEEDKQKSLDIKRARAKEVDDAYRTYAVKVKESESQNRKLYNEYIELRNSFIAEYGSYHASYTDDGIRETSLSDLFAEFFGTGRK